MKRLRSYVTPLIFLILGAGVVLATDLFRTLSINLRTYNNVVKQLISEYVDEVDSEKLITGSIRGMLGQLDPYTVFIREEGQAAVNMLTRGKYGGVGIQMGMRGDTLTVISPMEGTPAYRAGIQTGDKIIAIDSVKTRDLRLDEAAGRIRGKVGTTVQLTMRRYGEADPLVFTIVRDEIKVNDMPYYGVDNGIGYIKIARFSRDTGDQFRRVVQTLKTQGMQRLVLDLRDNPGGLLRDAVVMVDAMVEPGVAIVETRGRAQSSNRKFFAESEPVLGPEIPLAVLVNQGSASASEIVAGAIQDLDRGVIIGQQTFGKGLVQTIFPVGRRTSLKLTTSKYYIPSGRLIQKEDYLKNGAVSSELVDEDSVFVTRAGRRVEGGGGVMPDIHIVPAPIPPLTQQLWRHAHFFTFASAHKADYNLSLPVLITPEIIAGFRAYLQDKSVDPVFQGENILADFEKTIADLDDFEGSVDLAPLRQYYADLANQAFDAEIDFIRRRLRLEFSAVLGGLEQQVRSGLADDPVYQTSVKTLSDPLVYARYLQPTATAVTGMIEQ